jgi:PAS domain S-box-containing protein
MDVSELKRAEQSAQRLAAIVASSDDAIVSKNLDGIISTWNKGAERLFGYTAEEVVGKPITILIPPERQDEEPGILARIRAGERVDHYETVRRRKDGTLVEISLTVSPVKSAAGQVVGASKIARDITERKQAEARMTLLAREVDHRAKNILATVMALTRMTRADTVPAFTEALMGRIRALSQAHTLFAKSRWTGAEIRQLVEEELDAFGTDGDGHLRISGPRIVLLPDAAQGLAMALHELATNAAKYGAFSMPGGRVAVEWATADGRLVLRWTETGGPPVRTPSRRGFGTSLIEATTRSQLDGEARFDWRVEGLACEISIPAAKLARV